MQRRRIFLRYWLPVYLYAGFIFALSSIPESLPGPEETGIPFLDKGVHLIEYGIFGYLLARALKNSTLNVIKTNFRIVAVLFATLYGFTDEFHQSFISDRSASLGDIVFDGIGAAAGAMIIQRSRPKDGRSLDEKGKN